MKIFVTGASGFLGRHLCEYIEKAGHFVVKTDSKNCDLTKQDSLKKFSDISYDLIYHLAAWTQAGDFCLYHPGEQWIINQLINTNLLQWWKESQPQAKLVCIGSSCAYSPEVEMTEENYMIGTPIESLFAYAMCKRMLYTGLVSLNKQFGFKYLYLVPNTLYGPNYHPDQRQMHFIFDLIKKILRGKMYNEPVILWGDGYQRREVVYVEDFVRIMVHLVNMCENDIINVAPSQELSIREYAKLISEIIGYDYNSIQYDVSRYVGVFSKCLVNKKLKKLIPDVEFTPLEVGLRRTIDWFKNFGPIY